MIFKKIQKNKGFTLIELMIATTLFAIIMMMGVGSLVVSSNSARASQKLRIAVDNVNFAMESMTRELRIGTYYYCVKYPESVYLTNATETKDCEGGDIISFKPQDAPAAPLRVAYKKSLRADGTFSLQRCETNVSPCPDIVSSEVDVQELKFFTTGSTPNPTLDLSQDTIQPGVKIIIKGIVKVKNIETPFVLQSFASQRSSEK